MISRGLHGVIVLPGDRLDSRVEGKYPEVIEVNSLKIATLISLVSQRDDKLIIVPLKNIYIPEPGHIVIGLVESIGMVNWFVDINSPYQAILHVQDFLGRPFNPASDDLYKLMKPGDYVKAKVLSFDKTRNPVLSVQGEGLGKIVKGTIVDIQPAKIPRVIGKKRSMISMLEEKTGCSIFPAVNGRVYIECPNRELEAILVMAIRLIDRESHRLGLTERVAKFIDEERMRRGV
ncbi:MAG: exosome complex RNA-binding protein Rrp4 [Acidilobaceae archaeon]